MSSKPELRVTDADAFAHNKDHAFVILEIQRADVEAGNIASALERLLILTDSRENVMRYQESLALAFAGYDDDPRHLPEIPEVRQFMARLHKEWPFWMWFCVRFAGAIPLVISMLCDVRIIDQGGAEFGTEILDMPQMAATIRDMLERSDAMFNVYSIDEHLRVRSSHSALAELGLA